MHIDRWRCLVRRGPQFGGRRVGEGRCGGAGGGDGHGGAGDGRGGTETNDAGTKTNGGGAGRDKATTRTLLDEDEDKDTIRIQGVCVLI